MPLPIPNEDEIAMTVSYRFNSIKRDPEAWHLDYLRDPAFFL